jgi:hypothetical protein
MHPRNRFSPLLVTAFHVTNSGWSSTVEAKLVALLASLIPLGVELALCTLEELPVAADGARRRDIAAGLYEGSIALGGDSESSTSGTSSGSVVVGSSVYFDHSASISRRERLGRFSRLAERLSKQ